MNQADLVARARTTSSPLSLPQRALGATHPRGMGVIRFSAPAILKPRWRYIAIGGALSATRPRSLAHRVAAGIARLGALLGSFG